MLFQLEHFQSDNFSELVDDSVGFVVPCRKGGYIVGLGRSLSHVDWDSRKITKLHEVDKETKNRFNDGKCDPRGRVWAGKYLILYPASRQFLDLQLEKSERATLLQLMIARKVTWIEKTIHMYL